MGSWGTEEIPSSMVETSRERPVLTFLTATAAPAIAAPLESVTVPRMVPRKVWALVAPAKDKRIAAKPNSNADLQMPKHTIIELSSKFCVFINSPKTLPDGTPSPRWQVALVQDKQNVH